MFAAKEALMDLISFLQREKILEELLAGIGEDGFGMELDGLRFCGDDAGGP